MDSCPYWVLACAPQTPSRKKVRCRMPAPLLPLSGRVRTEEPRDPSWVAVEQPVLRRADIQT